MMKYDYWSLMDKFLPCVLIQKFLRDFDPAVLLSCSNVGISYQITTNIISWPNLTSTKISESTLLIWKGSHGRSSCFSMRPWN